MAKPDRELELAGASVQIYLNPADACRAAARVIADAITARGKAVLGLATGSTPEPVYAELVRLHRAGEVSFRDASTFNLDEYYPMSPLDPQSYRSYMHRLLFDHVDLAPNRAHVLDGTVPEAFAEAHAAEFDRWISDEGGLDFQLLGLGRNGHVGFNEPSDLPVETALALPTRPVGLHPITIADAARDFGGEEFVPRRALTVGTASILGARSILVLAFGTRKADSVAKSLLGPITAEVPGSLLRASQGKVTWMLDPASASGIL